MKKKFAWLASVVASVLLAPCFASASSTSPVDTWNLVDGATYTTSQSIPYKVNWSFPTNYTSTSLGGHTANLLALVYVVDGITPAGDGCVVDLRQQTTVLVGGKGTCTAAYTAYTTDSGSYTVSIGPLSAGTHTIEVGASVMAVGGDVFSGLYVYLINMSYTPITINVIGTSIAPPAAPSATLSASPTSCTILSGASSCAVPFTWNILNATAPNLYNSTTGVQYTTAASFTNFPESITYGSNIIQARDGTTVLKSITVTGNCPSGTGWSGSVCAVTNPPSATLSASPLSCTILSGASSCTVPFTWSIAYTNNPWVYNRKTGIIYSQAVSGSNVPYSVTYGPNVVDAIDANTYSTLASVTVTGNCPAGSTWNSSTGCSAVPLPNLIISGFVTPTTLTAGTATNFSTTVKNIGTASTGTSFSNFFQVATAANGGGIVIDIPSTSMNALVAGATGTATSPSYTFGSAGAYSVRACADKTSSLDGGVIVELSESDNCGVWNNISVTLPDLTITGAITPTTLTAGTATNFSAAVKNIGTASTGTSFSNFFQVATAANGGGIVTDLAPTTMLALSTSLTSVATSPFYSFTAPGTYSVRVCADKASSNDLGVITESDETNNCGGWTTVTVTSVALSATLSSSPTSCTIVSGASTCMVAFTWNIVNAASPNLYNSTRAIQYISAASGNNVSYAVTNGINTIQARGGTTVLATNSVTGTCATGTVWNGNICAVSSNAPIALLSVNPISVVSGGSATLTWGSTNATACTAGGPWSNSGTLSGSGFTNPLTANTTFTFQCTGPGGMSPLQSVTVTVTPLSLATATLSANQLTCVIPSNANVCIPLFTWNIVNAATPNLYNSTRLMQYSTAPTGTNTPYPVTYGVNTIVARDRTTVLSSVSVTGNCATGTVWNGSVCSPSVAYSINAVAGSGGSISPASATVAQGGNASFAIIPNAGYSVIGVSVDGIPQGPLPSYTFINIQANHTLTALFASSLYAITASAGLGGNISPAGQVLVNRGSNQAFTITPSTGYSISLVSVDGVNQGALSSYLFTNVQAAHTINVVFVVNTVKTKYWQF